MSLSPVVLYVSSLYPEIISLESRVIRGRAALPLQPNQGESFRVETDTLLVDHYLIWAVREGNKRA